MILNSDQIYDLPDGTELKTFLSGSYWDEDFGKVENVIKVKDRLWIVEGYHYINELKENDNYEIEVAIRE